MQAPTAELEAGTAIMLGGTCLANRLDDGGGRALPQDRPQLSDPLARCHADFKTSQITPSGNVHGMPVACLCGSARGADALGFFAGVARGRDRQIGIRSSTKANAARA